MEHLNNQPNAASATAQAFNETTRLTYSAPTITSVEFAVDHGFEASPETQPNSIGLRFFVSGHTTMDQTDDTEQKWTTASNDWF